MTSVNEGRLKDHRFGDFPEGDKGKGWLGQMWAEMYGKWAWWLGTFRSRDLLQEDVAGEVVD